MVISFDLKNERGRLLQTPCLPLSLSADKKKKIAELATFRWPGRIAKTNIPPGEVLQTTSLFTVCTIGDYHVAQLTIHNSCHKRKKKIELGVPGCNLKLVVHCPTVLQSRFDDKDITVRLGVFFGRRNGRASLWLLPLDQDAAPGRINVEVMLWFQMTRHLLSRRSAGRFISAELALSTAASPRYLKP